MTWITDRHPTPDEQPIIVETDSGFHIAHYEKYDKEWFVDGNKSSCCYCTGTTLVHFGNPYDGWRTEIKRWIPMDLFINDKV